MNLWTGWLDQWLQTAKAVMAVQRRTARHTVKSLMTPVALALPVPRPAKPTTTAPRAAPGAPNVVGFPAAAVARAVPTPAPAPAPEPRTPQKAVPAKAPLRSRRKPGSKPTGKAKPKAAPTAEPKTRGRQSRVRTAKPARAPAK
jgi:hypothetical protein